MFRLEDELIVALKTKIETNIGAYITAINAAASSDPTYQIETPQAYFDYIPTLSELVAFPAVAIGEGNIDFEDDTGWSATGVFDLAVVCYVHDFEQRALAWKLRRFTQAVANAVMVNRTLPPAGWGMRLLRIEPGPTLGRREDPRRIMSMRAILIEVRAEQDQ